MRNYFEKAKYVQCNKCKHFFEIPFWQRLAAVLKLTNSCNSRVECPRCGKHYKLKVKGAN